MAHLSDKGVFLKNHLLTCICIIRLCISGDSVIAYSEQACLETADACWLGMRLMLLSKAAQCMQTFIYLLLLLLKEIQNGNTSSQHEDLDLPRIKLHSLSSQTSMCSSW